MTNSAVIWRGPGDLRELSAYDFHKMDIVVDEYDVEMPMVFKRDEPVILPKDMASVLVNHELVYGEFEQSTVAEANEFLAAQEAARVAALPPPSDEDLGAESEFQPETGSTASSQEGDSGTDDTGEQVDAKS